VSALWYDASNLDNRVNQAGHNLNSCKRNAAGTATNCRTGFGDDWVDVFLNWRYTF
jgi:hypothetical protein